VFRSGTYLRCGRKVGFCDALPMPGTQRTYVLPQERNFGAISSIRNAASPGALKGNGADCPPFLATECDQIPLGEYLPIPAQTPGIFPHGGKMRLERRSRSLRNVESGTVLASRRRPKSRCGGPTRSTRPNERESHAARARRGAALPAEKPVKGVHLRACRLGRRFMLGSTERFNVDGKRGNDV